MSGCMPVMSPGSFRVGPWRPLGEGDSLSFPRPPGLLQVDLEPFHLGSQFVDLPGLTPDKLEEIIVR